MTKTKVCIIIFALIIVFLISVTCGAIITTGPLSAFFTMIAVVFWIPTIVFIIGTGVMWFKEWFNSLPD